MSSEADQTTILIRSLQNAGAWARKYPDLQGLIASILARFGLQRRIGEVSLMLPKNPCDVEVQYRGLGIHIEVKYQDGYGAFNRRVFERKDGTSQLDDLLAYEEAGGIGVVALVVWQSRQYSRLLLWRVGELLQAMGERGSIVKADLVKVPYLSQEGAGNAKSWYLGAWLDSWRGPEPGWMPPNPLAEDDQRKSGELGVTEWPCPFCAMTDHPTLTAPEFSDTDDQECEECRGTLRVGYDTRPGYPGWTDEAIAWLREYEAVREADEVLP